MILLYTNVMMAFVLCYELNNVLVHLLVLFTLCTILNAIVCCLQLNTGRGADANPNVDYLVTDACWIAVCVLCRNAQMNL